MNRSGMQILGYSDDEDDQLEYGRWRAQVNSAIRGRRGQAFLKELAAAMDAMPEKKLIESEFIDADGACCTLGVVCKARGLDVTGWDVEDADAIARKLGIAEQMVREIEYLNDDSGYWNPSLSPTVRWRRMRAWVESKIKK